MVVSRTVESGEDAVPSQSPILAAWGTTGKGCHGYARILASLDQFLSRYQQDCEVQGKGESGQRNGKSEEEVESSVSGGPGAATKAMARAAEGDV